MVVTSGGPAARVLVRIPNWLGDVLMARPLLHALRRGRPEATIVGFGPAPLLALLAGEELFDASVAWPSDRTGRARARAALRAHRPDVALVLPPSWSTAWLAWRSGARMRVGFAHEGRSPLLTHAVRRPARGDLHLSDEYLALGAAMGLGAVPVPRLVLPASALGAGRALEARAGVGEAPFAVLGPGAQYGPAKRWGAERFAALGRALAARGLRVLVCGTAAERGVADEVAAAIGAGAVALAGESDLPGLAALCARAALAVCNDSGLAHLAASVGAPTVAVFGSTSSAWTAPLGERVRVVQRAPVCSPCFRRTCRIGYRCLTAIEVRDVLRASVEVAA